MEGQQKTSLDELCEAISSLSYGVWIVGQGTDGTYTRGTHETWYPGCYSIKKVAAAFKDSNNQLYEGWSAVAKTCSQIHDAICGAHKQYIDGILSFINAARENENKSIAAIDNAIEAGNNILNELGLNDNR